MFVFGDMHVGRPNYPPWFTFDANCQQMGGWTVRLYDILSMQIAASVCNSAKTPKANGVYKRNYPFKAATY